MQYCVWVCRRIRVARMQPWKLCRWTRGNSEPLELTRVTNIVKDALGVLWLRGSSQKFCDEEEVECSRRRLEIARRTLNQQMNICLGIGTPPRSQNASQRCLPTMHPKDALQRECSPKGLVLSSVDALQRDDSRGAPCHKQKPRRSYPQRLGMHNKCLECPRSMKFGLSAPER